MKKTCMFLAVGIIATSAATASAITTRLTFEDLKHGEIVNTQYADSHGVVISADNRGGGPDLVAAFDSHRRRTRDRDLEDPWRGGNMTRHKFLGNLLIIEENDYDNDGDGFIPNPDDEGSRPAGSIYIEFLTGKVTSLGFDLVDVERHGEYNGHGYVGFYKEGDLLTKIGWGEFVDPSSAHYRHGVRYGDNYANRIAPMGADELGIGRFDMVEFNLGGSGAVDNLTYDIAMPEPITATLSLVGMSALAITLRRRREPEA